MNKIINKEKLILLFFSVFYILPIIIIDAVFLESPNIIKIVVPFIVVGLIYLFGVFSKKNKIVKILLKIFYILILLITLGMSIILIVNEGNLLFISLIVLIYLSTSIFIIAKIGEADDIKLKKSDYLPLLFNFVFVIVIVILINYYSNLVLESKLINWGKMLSFDYMLYLLRPQILLNIYIYTLLYKKKLKK